MNLSRVFGQWMLTPQGMFNPPDGMKCLEMSDGYHLYVDPHVEFTRATQADGSTWVLIGHAWQSDPSKPAPEKQLDVLGVDTVDATVRDWSGRWLLIGDGQVWTDAAAQLRCHYFQRKGRMWVTSSPLMLRYVLFYLHAHDPIEDKDGLASGWVVPPRSGYKDVRLLLPTQRLRYRSHEIVPRDPLGAEPSTADNKQLLDELVLRYRTILSRLDASGRHVCLGLSGGHDSRVILAAVSSAGADIRAYTFVREGLAMPRGDAELPPRLAEAVHVPYMALEGLPRSPERLQAFDELIEAYQTSPASFFHYYTRGYLQGFPSGAILLNGLCGEMGRGYYRKKLPERPIDWHFCKTLYRHTLPNRQGVYELGEWWAKHYLPMDIRERWYWEGRLAGWASTASYQIGLVTQGQRLAYISPANCAAIMRRILALSDEWTKGAAYLKELVRTLAPRLAEFPYNPQETLWRRIARKAMRGRA